MVHPSNPCHGLPSLDLFQTGQCLFYSMDPRAGSWLMRKANLPNFRAGMQFQKKVAELLPLEERNMILSSRVLSSTVPQDSHFPRTSRAIGRISFSFHLTLASSAPKQIPQLASFLKEIGRYFLDLTTSILRFLTDLRGKECSLSLTPLTGLMPV